MRMSKRAKKIKELPFGLNGRMIEVSNYTTDKPVATYHVILSIG